MARKPSGKAAHSSDSQPESESPGPSRDRVRQGILALLACVIVGIVAVGAGSSLFGASRHHASDRQTILNPDARLAEFYTPTVMWWAADIYRWAAEYEVNPNVIAIVIQIESCGDQQAISSAGALGLMQVMPFHFDDGENMINPDTNVENGMTVFYECLMQFADGDLGVALACYNGGPSVTQRDYTTWATETQYYYRWATGLWTDVVNGRERSETLDAWLAAGGQRLCDAINMSALTRAAASSLG